MVEPPIGFDEAFFVWLDRASEDLSISFASKGGLPKPVIRQLEQQLGFPLPEDLRQFYARYSVWGLLRDWHGWEGTKLHLSKRSGSNLPLLPIDQRSYSSTGWDVVAAVESPERYQVIASSRSTGELRIYESLRAYFIAEVEDEAKLCSE
jgi:hypothetical protein